MLLTGVFNWVFETSIMAGILAILIIIIKYIFKNTLGPKWHYAIWGLLIIRLIIPISIESSLSIYNVLHPNIIEVQKPLQLSSNSGVSNYSLKDNPQKNISQNSDTPAKVQDSNKVQYKDKSTNGFYYRLMYMLPTIWLAGALILSLFIISQSIVFCLTVKNEILLRDEMILKLLNDGKAILGIKRSIPIVKTNKVRTPCLFGVLTPKILIPESLLYEFSEENLKCILLHELSHYKRKDILVNWISVILQAINWFNPIIWYSFRKMREDCELACDDYVLRHVAEKVRVQYGLSIMNLLSISRSIWTPVTTGIFGNNKKQIMRRIKAIIVFKKSNIKWTVITVALIICLGVIALTNPKVNQTSSTNTQIQSSNSAKYGGPFTTASFANNSNNEPLYGKYQDPILKVIGDNPDVKKDYKEVTSDDLKKIKSFAYYRNNGDYPDESFYIGNKTVSIKAI